MRMKAGMKRALREAFEAPVPLEKERFLKRIPCAQINHVQFMLLQAAYIKKWVWVVSAVVFGIALREACFVGKDIVWGVSSMMPFLALSITTENARSAAYGMEELEMASRFSLRSVVLARLGILGVFHLFLLFLLASLSLPNSVHTLLQTGVYLTVPYLLTTASGLAVTRRFHGKEAIYVCMGIAVGVSGIYMMADGSAAFLYKTEYFPCWLATLIALIAVLSAECRRTIKQTEELVWNLQ